MNAPPLPRNRSVPAATVIPVLRYRDVRAAVAWLCDAFGFRERLQIAEHRAQLTFGDGALVVADGGEAPATGAKRDSVMIRVQDLDAHCERARRHGAEIVNPPTDYPFGERQYSAVDPYGHHWTFTQTTADSNPSSWGGILKMGDAAGS